MRRLSDLKRKVVCLTPCKNEAWILETFLSAASLWADIIVVGDQASTDGSRDIIKRFPKAVLVDNPWVGFGYHQGNYQKVVLDKAREIPGEKILLTLDADELLTADALADSGFWRWLDSAPQGTPIYGSWVNLCPDFKQGFDFGGEFLIGAVDGPTVATHEGKHHVPRLKVDPVARPMSIAPYRIMHYQFVDFARHRSKQRFYAVVEWVERNGQRPYDLYRRLHPYETNTTASFYRLEPRWTESYEAANVNWSDVSVEGAYRWDESVLSALLKYRPATFRKLDIWDHDWTMEAKRRGHIDQDLCLRDPRSLVDKAVHWLCRKTQPYAHSLPDRLLRQAMRLLAY